MSALQVVTNKCFPRNTTWIHFVVFKKNAKTA